MKSARINFGIPESEYIMEVDDSGAATSLVNQDTGTEYVGGGGDLEVVEVEFVRGTATGSISLVVPVVDSWTELDGTIVYYTSGMMYLQAGENERTLNVIMCKGLAGLYSQEEVTFIGDIYDEDSGCISGAGTITVNAV